jgi:phytoene desaturase
VIGSGFSGLSCAAVLARRGLDVTVLEQHDQAGGRARVWRHDGFSFDMGPSWYWMPDVAERFFQRFGRTTADYLDLRRLDPSYQVVYPGAEVLEAPASYEALRAVFEREEPGSAIRLDRFLREAEAKYRIGMQDFVYKPSLRVGEFLDLRSLRSSVRMDLFSSFARHIRSFFRSEKLLQLLEFPVLFLGAMPDRIPALYSMMNYADIRLGTWYPMGGFGELARAFESVAREQGAAIRFDTRVTGFEFAHNRIAAVQTTTGRVEADVVVGSADYHHIEQELLPAALRRYSPEWWDKRTMSPSCLLYYLGVGRRLPRLLHHNLFFDTDFRRHAAEIYGQPAWPHDPLFYVCAPSKTDPSVAPEGCENLFALIPVAPGLQDTPEVRERYLDLVLQRLEAFTGVEIASEVIVKRSYAYSDFRRDYNAFKGNAYGLANTLEQTAFLKPRMHHGRVPNLYYCGQLTVPGPGVPPAIISGQVAADYITSKLPSISLESAL